MIRIRFLQQSDERLVAFLESRTGEMLKKLQRTMTRLMLLLQQHVQQDKLSGQVLSQRSGRLVNSVRTHPARIEGTKVVGEVTAGGSALKARAGIDYGLMWETTGHKAYAVNATNAQALKFMIGGTEIFRKYAFIPAVGPKPFMKPAQDDMAPRIVSDLQETLNDVLQGRSS